MSQLGKLGQKTMHIFCKYAIKHERTSSFKMLIHSFTLITYFESQLQPIQLMSIVVDLFMP